MGHIVTIRHVPQSCRVPIKRVRRALGIAYNKQSSTTGSSSISLREAVIIKGGFKLIWEEFKAKTHSFGSDFVRDWNWAVFMYLIFDVELDA